MENPDNKTLHQQITETLQEALQFQKENISSPLLWAAIDHLILRVEEALENRHYETLMESLRNIKEVIAGSELRKQMSGRVQIVTADTWEAAEDQCPWACRFQSVGKLKEQKEKWICFETDAAADFYQGL